MENNSLFKVDNSKEDETIYFCKLSLAGLNVEIESYNKHVLYGFRDYLACFNNPDIIIKALPSDYCGTIDDDVLWNHEKMIATEYVGMEFSAILCDLAEQLLARQTLLIHGAAIEHENQCFIFTAPSGTGKTTHIMNWLKMIPDVTVINGDKPFINVNDLLVYGTPWCGKEGFNTNKASHLAGIIELRRGEINRINKITYKEMLPVLLTQTFIPSNSNLAVTAYNLSEKMVKVPCYRLYCNMNEDSALVAYNGLKGQI